MTSVQYEELCRLAIAKTLGIPVSIVYSGRLPNPSRPGLPEYVHQVDLWWETEDSLARYFNIANAKWRSSDKIDQPDVLLLAQVKQKLAAQKAMMFTPVGFTAGAIAVAKDEGIGLHILMPSLEVSRLQADDQASIQAALQGLASSSSSPLFAHEVIYKAFEFGADRQNVEAGPRTLGTTSTGQTAGYTTKVVTNATAKTADPSTKSNPGGPDRTGPGFVRK